MSRQTMTELSDKNYGKFFSGDQGNPNHTVGATEDFLEAKGCEPNLRED